MEPEVKKQDLDDIIQKIETGKLAVFCGAGISFHSGIPVVIPIIEALLRNLECPEEHIDQFLIEGEEERFEIERKKKETEEKKRDTFPMPFETIIQSLKERINLDPTKHSKDFIHLFADKFQAEPNPQHHLLAYLLSTGKITTMITTNFDTCLEQAWEQREGNSPEVLIPYNMEIEEVKKANIQGKIVKVHGCKNHPDTLGTTRDAVSNKEATDRTDAILDKVFSGDLCDTVLFLGYSCSDKWDIVEYYQTKVKPLPTPKVKTIYWQYRKKADSPIDKNPLEMFGEAAEYKAGNTDTLAKKLAKHYAIENEIGDYWKKSDFQADWTVTNKEFVLGGLFYDSGHRKLAEGYWNKALQIYRDLAEESPQVFLPDMAGTLNNLGLLQQANNEFPQALESYKEALKIRRKLAEKSPQVFLPDVATTLNNLGNLQKDNNENSRALESYKEALKIRRKLAEESPQVFLPDVAGTLNNLGICNRLKTTFLRHWKVITKPCRFIET